MLDKVLCIDDDPITLIVCNHVIKKAVFAEEIATSKHGKAALNWFSEYFKQLKTGVDLYLPHLIFLDLNMPVMNGWEFLEDFVMKYSDRTPKLKVVILSSSVNPEDYSKSKQYDIVIDFINKPLTVEGLEELKKNEHLKPFFE